MALDLAELKKLRAYLDALIQAEAVLAEPEPQAPEPVDVAAWNVSRRNRILAGSGEKAELLGTISTEPVVTDKTFIDLDVPNLADGIVKRAAEIRSAALALTAVKP